LSPSGREWLPVGRIAGSASLPVKSIALLNKVDGGSIFLFGLAGQRTAIEKNNQDNVPRRGT
jgi:hypothetical protein